MPTIQRRRYCSGCGKRTLHSKTTTEKPGCLIMLMTCGLAGIASLLGSLWDVVSPLRCQVCGKAKILS